MKLTCLTPTLPYSFWTCSWTPFPRIIKRLFLKGIVILFGMTLLMIEYSKVLWKWILEYLDILDFSFVSRFEKTDRQSEIRWFVTKPWKWKLFHENVDAQIDAPSENVSSQLCSRSTTHKLEKNEPLLIDLGFCYYFSFCFAT